MSSGNSTNLGSEFETAQQDEAVLQAPSMLSGSSRETAPDDESAALIMSAMSEQGQLVLQELQHKWKARQNRLRATGKTAQAFDLPVEWHARYMWLYAKTKDKRSNSKGNRDDGNSNNTNEPEYYFPTEKIHKAEKKLQPRFLRLSMASLAPQISSKTLFPVPNLKSKDGGHGMFYMRPSRYNPKSTSIKTIIANLVYVMNSMVENNAHARQHGIGFVANMDDWTMSNFDTNYCYQFMMALQGCLVPVKVRLFLIANPPSWFGAVWNIMKPMLAPSFRKRVKMCPESKLPHYLAEGYQQYLPDDMASGQANTDDIVEEYIANRKREDGCVGGQEDESKETDSLSSRQESISVVQNEEAPVHGTNGTVKSSNNDQSFIGYESDEGGEDDASIHCDIDDLEDFFAMANDSSTW